jgi:hypothetical protein
MSPQQKTLSLLQEELRNIQIFDRVHDYETEPGAISERAYAVRQLRRKQILDEIARLRASRPEPLKAAKVGRAVFFVCATGYAMLYYLLALLSAQMAFPIHSAH